MTKKCTKNYNARVQLLFCSLNLLFGDVLVAVAVVFDDIVVWPVQRRFAYRAKFQKLFNDRGEIRSNLGYSLAFPASKSNSVEIA